MWYSIIALASLYLGFRVGLNTDMSISIRNELDFLQDKIDLINEEKAKALELAETWERRYNYLVSIQQNQNEYDAV